MTCGFSLQIVGKWMVVEREAVGLCEGMSDYASCKIGGWLKRCKQLIRPIDQSRCEVPETESCSAPAGVSASEMSLLYL